MKNLQISNLSIFDIAYNEDDFAELILSMISPSAAKELMEIYGNIIHFARMLSPTVIRIAF